MSNGVNELAEIVSTAKQATEELADTDLRQVAFERVLDHLLKNGGPSFLQSPPLLNRCQVRKHR